MARRKKATDSSDSGLGDTERPDSAGEVGGSDDAATGARLAVKLLNRDLRAIASTETSPMDPEWGTLVALYARTLSAIERDGRKGATGEYSSKSLEELAEMARNIPELKELLKRP